MQYDVKTPLEYINGLEPDWRRNTLLEIRKIIADKAPKLVEGIDYKMLGYKDEKGLAFCLNAQKNHVGLYFGDIKKVDPDNNLLQGLDCGKGCIRFKKSNKVTETRIAEFIEKSIDLWNKGIDIGC
ncbi:MAG: DUF1801 domain-containing protein [Bacteroidota bacterium]